MALINCPECKKEISDKASSCPNCGLPLNREGELICPNFPSNLSLGSPMTAWFEWELRIHGYFESKENVVEGIPSGKVHVLLYERGISIRGSWYLSVIDIHNSQIISLSQTTQEELIQKKKSVVGRAIVGGILTGGIGAIIGGMSGLGSKTKKGIKYYLIINYWDIKTKKPMSILIGTDTEIALFIKKWEKEKGAEKKQTVSDNSLYRDDEPQKTDILRSKELFQKAYNLHYKTGALSDALELYKQIISTFPDSAEAGYARIQVKETENNNYGEHRSCL